MQLIIKCAVAASLLIGAAGGGNFLFLYLKKHSPEQEGKKAQSALKQPSSDALSVFTLVGTTETGRRKWDVSGQTADLLNETVHLTPVAATSYGDVTVYLTATSGRFQKVRQDVHLEGDVVVTTSDGVRMLTDSLDWSAKAEKGTTPDWVTVTRPGMVILGRGGVGIPKKKRFRLHRQVKVILEGGQIGPGGRRITETVITCRGPMEVDHQRHRARFWRDVRVQDSRGVIRSDRMDVELDPATQQIQEATCWGHVVIRQENQISFSHRAKYWQDPARTRLTGHTRIVLLPEEEQVAP